MPLTLKRHPPYVLIGLGLALLFALAVAWVGYSSWKNDQQSKAYIDKMVPVVFKNWDPNLILQEANPELKDYFAKDPQMFLSMIRSMKESMGSMTAYHGCKKMNQRIKPSGKALTLGYVVDADFEKGHNFIILKTTLNDGQWRLCFFLLEPQAETKYFKVTPTLHP